MNLGLGNLDDLKQFILPEGVRDQTEHEAVLARIGLGVVARFEGFCNRAFDRVVGAEDTFTGDHFGWTLQRYPVGAIASVALKATDAEGWIVQPDAIEISKLESGRIDFASVLGGYRSLVRITYTGGYWYETLEPAENGYPSTMPVGATAVPDDLKLAWLMQCQSVWEGKDHMLPKGLAADGQTTIPFNLRDVRLLPEVEGTLRAYLRYQLV